MAKPWYKSKSVWSALIVGVVGVLQALGYSIPNEAYALAGALGIYGLRMASEKIR